MKDFQNNDEWNVWAKYVLMTLLKHEQDIKDNSEKAQTRNEDFLIFKTKIETRSAVISSIIGFIMGILAAAAIELIFK